MSTRGAIVACRASKRKVFLSTFLGVSFSTATPISLASCHCRPKHSEIRKPVAEVGAPKSKASRASVPLHPLLAGFMQAWKNTTPGNFLAAFNYKTGSNSSFVAVADLNGDGKPDIAVANSGGLADACPPTCGLSGSLSVLLQEPAGSGHFMSAKNYAAQDQVLGVAAVDVNGDGKTDLVIDNGAGVVLRLQDPTQPGSSLDAVAIPN